LCVLININHNSAQKKIIIIIIKITTVTKYINKEGNRYEERIVTSTVFNGGSSYQQFNSLNDAQFRGTLLLIINDV
jgi:hypothetical protein